MADWGWGTSEYDIQEGYLIFLDDESGGLKCQHCDQLMKARVDTMQRHYKRNHPDVERRGLIPTVKVRCSACKELGNPSHQVRHKKTCTGEDKRQKEVDDKQVG